MKEHEHEIDLKIKIVNKLNQMGLFTILIEGLAVSAGFAATRQFAGYSFKDYILPKIQHPLINTIASGYFEAGEFVVTSATDLYKSYEKDMKDNKDKKD